MRTTIILFLLLISCTTRHYLSEIPDEYQGKWIHETGNYFLIIEKNKIFEFNRAEGNKDSLEFTIISPTRLTGTEIKKEDDSYPGFIEITYFQNKKKQIKLQATVFHPGLNKYLKIVEHDLKGNKYNWYRMDMINDTINNELDRLAGLK